MWNRQAEGVRMKKPKSMVRILHIGKKAPKGYKEVAGGVHLGKGLWILPIDKITELTTKTGGRR